LLTAGFVDYPGVSAVLAEGVVAYSNESKIARLGVTKQTLDKYGAVSAQTAAEMASGVAKTASAGVGISTTGIAGPGGGSYEKPVGLVYIGLSVNKRISTKELRLTGDRSAVRNKAVKLAMEFLLQSLKDI
jgi:nicotinamide-nucleotide amidase